MAVLLLLYLALDDADDRPLIIDQPEENLDPKSVFDELVPLFMAAKSKRQVVMVAHNANLVINTDADQIIFAEAGPQTDCVFRASHIRPRGYIRKAVWTFLKEENKLFESVHDAWECVSTDRTAAKSDERLFLVVLTQATVTAALGLPHRLGRGQSSTPIHNVVVLPRL